MLNLRKAGAIAGILAALATATGAAQSMSAVSDTPSRFSGPGIYSGPPALPVTLSMVQAGGGPSNFSSLTLIGVLAGKNADAEIAKLSRQYGKDQVGQFVTTFNFVVDDSLKIASAKGVKLPSTPQPDPNNGEALAGALWNAGQTAHGFNVEVMLDRAVSHPIHLQVMKDIDAKYGLAADAQYHAILTTAMTDLAAAYGLKGA
jgi:hypothetical protein